MSSWKAAQAAFLVDALQSLAAGGPANDRTCAAPSKLSLGGEAMTLPTPPLSRLVLAERPLTAPTLPAAARPAIGTGRSLGVVGSSALGDRARAPADQAAHVPTALRTRLQRGLRHLLALLKMVGAGFTQIFVRWHGFGLSHRL
jgi:hypothetical protein